MNLRLDPPPVPPLTPTTRARLRTQVMDQSAPRRQLSRPARWAVPALAVAAVAGVVTGTLVVVNQADPSVAPPVASGGQVPDAIKVDRGPATAAEVKAAMARCTLPGVKRMEPLWSRKVAEVIPGQSATGVIVLAKNTPAPPGNGVALGLEVCYTRARSGGVDDHAWAERPTEAQGITKLADGFTGYGGPGKPLVVEFNDLYRIRPEITHLQARLVWKHGATAWFDGVVDSGFAYTASGAALPPGQYDTEIGSKTEPYGIRQELRAYDSSGNLVPLTY